MCSFVSEPIIPDYSKPLAHVYSEAMAHIICNDFASGYPTLMVNKADGMNDVDLPTWVVDFMA